MKRTPLILLSAAITLVFMAFFASTTVPTALAQEESNLTAVRVGADISDPLATAWNDVPALTVALEPETEDSGLPTVAGVHYGAIPEVKLQAAYDDHTLWIRAVWADNTIGNIRGTWTFDGTTWVQNAQDQDRLALIFDISGNPQFSALGCGAVCHSADTSASDYMGFPPENSTDALDVWQWKASQTAPADYSDDQWLGSYVDENGPKAPVNDASTSDGTVRNQNEAGDGPAFIYPPDAMPGDPLFADTAVPFDASMTFEAGYTVPGYVVSRPQGSRGDINGTSVHLTYMNGTGWWYVVLNRPFDTGNQEDHVFSLNSNNVFGVAVFNNSGDKMHATHDRLTLTIGS
jgi:hypothetical protein